MITIKIKLSNRQKLEKLYVIYENKMYALAYSILHNKAQAEDIVHDSFVKLTDYLDKIKDPDDARTKALVLKIVKNNAINRYHKNQREAWLYDFNDNDDIADPHDVIDKKLTEINNCTILTEAAKDMPDIYKEVIRMRCYMELSTREIADITGLDTATIRKRYERAKKYLYDHIIDKGGLTYEKEKSQFYAQLR